MISPIDATHNPALRSWVETANHQDTDFPIQNLPFGVFQSVNNSDSHIGVAIGDQIIDLFICLHLGLLDTVDDRIKNACSAPTLNGLMALGSEAITQLRHRLSELMRQDAPVLGNLLVPMAQATLLLPATIGDYTDFYASIFHATNVGKLFRPDQPLLPNYKYVPIAYHGRASSIVRSGTPIVRPKGQRKAPEDTEPRFELSRSLDYELEIGCFVGVGNALGQSVPIDQAERHIFGLCLVNDWSARDIQAWEYQPLGPFLAKSFATTISPWVVTLDALAPFRCPAFTRESSDPAPLPYLTSSTIAQQGGIDITLEVWLSSAQMREQHQDPIRLSRGSFRDLYWTIAQMLTHHTSNGCNLRTGDLFASGTVSGAQPGSQGCLLEITQRGANPIELPTGELRSFLVGGDEIIFRAYCEKEGYIRIGFGECRGTVLN